MKRICNPSTMDVIEAAQGLEEAVVIRDISWATEKRPRCPSRRLSRIEGGIELASPDERQWESQEMSQRPVSGIQPVSEGFRTSRLIRTQDGQLHQEFVSNKFPFLHFDLSEGALT